VNSLFMELFEKSSEGQIATLAAIIAVLATLFVCKNQKAVTSWFNRSLSSEKEEGLEEKISKVAKKEDEEEEEDKSTATATSTSTAASNRTSAKGRVNVLRELLDANPTAADGFLSYKYGFCAPRPYQRLPKDTSWFLWEEWTKKLPELYQTGEYRSFFEKQAVVSAEGLPDEDLLRANRILALCAHAVVNFSPKPLGGSNKKSESSIPRAIVQPWKQVTKRLGRPLPTLTFHDYFMFNVTPKDETNRPALFDPHRETDAASVYRDMRVDVPVFGDGSENVFVLQNHIIEYMSIPLVELCCQAFDCMLDEDEDGLARVLYDMGNVVKNSASAFLGISPNASSQTFCDTVGFSKSQGLLITPVLEGEISGSGMNVCLMNLLDVFLGRYEYSGELGALAIADRPLIPSLQREFLSRLGAMSVRQFVCRSESRALHWTFDRLVQLYASEAGFLGKHRIKISGFLEIGFKTARSESVGGLAKAGSGWQTRLWRSVNHHHLQTMNERMQLQWKPNSGGFTEAFVQAIKEQPPGCESYEIAFNVAGSGIKFCPGDRLEVLPVNRPTLVARMMEALQIPSADTLDSPLLVPVEGVEWKAAVERQYESITGQSSFPLPALLKIMTLRPVTRAMFDDVCGLAGVRGNLELEHEYEQGHIHDIPDLLRLIAKAFSSIHCGVDLDVTSLLEKLCSVLPPILPRLYSIANYVVPGEYPSTIQIVVSRLWYYANSVTDEQETRTDPFHHMGTPNESIRLGVCTSFLLNDSLYEFVPVRIVEEDSFHLPNVEDRGSIVMIALGSGAAPMLAFLEELLHRRRVDQCPEVFFCWGLAKSKNLFGLSLLSRAIKQIGLKLCISFSREDSYVEVVDDDIKVVPGIKERVTTTMMKGHWPQTLTRLSKGNGYFYLCGHPMLERTFRHVVESALCTSGLMSVEESTSCYEQLVAESRVRTDLFFSGSVHDPSLRSISYSEVARHHNVNDAWWIYKVRVVVGFSDTHPCLHLAHQPIFAGLSRVISTMSPSTSICSKCLWLQ
jgi:sulfite reductase alpha subunit-like flavoprotein